MNILIVDDDSLICDLVEKYVVNYIDKHESGREVSIEKLLSVQHMLTYLDKGIRPDVVFMDIKLNKYNGIDVAIKLQEVDAGLPVVFITGYIEYAKDIFNAKPFHFLVKPIKQADMDNVMERLIKYIDRKEKPLLTIKEKETTYFVNKEDIWYIEASFNNVLVHTSEKVYKTKQLFRDIEKQLEDMMIKCHRSYMINPSRIKKIEKMQIELQSGVLVPISRPRKKEVYEQLKMSV